MKVNCDECGKEFDKLPSAIKRTKHNFCHSPCAAAFNNKRRCGPYKGRREKYDRARELRCDGYGYRTIAKMLGVPWGTVRNWVIDVSIDDNKCAGGNAFEKAMELRRQGTPPYGIVFEELVSSGSIRKRLIYERGPHCERCGRDTWFEQPILLEVHHVDGDSENNHRENLRLLCLNCHSQTPNYRNKARS